MSIKNEIDRIKQSKADIISALTTKGVTVPSDASIDDLSALVDAIEVASDPVLQTKSATPKTSSQTIKPDSGYDGLSQVTISAVTSSIDSDIKASNIKKGVNILGVTGTLESGITPSGTMSITSNGTYDVTNYASANVNVSSGGSGGQYVTGEISVTEGEHSSGTTFATVSGLPFKPTHIIIQVKPGWSATTSVTTERGLLSLEAGLRSYSIYISKTYTYNSIDYVTVTMNDDGFSLTSKNSNLHTGGRYIYIAFGGEFENKGVF